MNIRTAIRIKINLANSCNHSVLYTVNRCLQMAIGSHSRNGFRHAEGYSYCSSRSSRTSLSYLAREGTYTQRTASFRPVCCDILNSNAFLQRSCRCALRGMKQKYSSMYPWKWMDVCIQFTIWPLSPA